MDDRPELEMTGMWPGKLEEVHRAGRTHRKRGDRLRVHLVSSLTLQSIRWLGAMGRSPRSQSWCLREMVAASGRDSFMQKLERPLWSGEFYLAQLCSTH